jgi:PAS domain S-box-containing protein
MMLLSPPHGKHSSISGEQKTALLAAIVAWSSDAILSKDLFGIVTSWNAEAERLLGYTESEIVGQSIRRLVPNELQVEEGETLAKISAGERIENYETVRVHKTGRLIDVSLTSSPIRDQSGVIVGASSILQDISARKKNERVAALLAAIVTSSSDAILSKTLNGTITSWNRAAEVLFGYSEGEMLGKSIRDVIPHELQSEEDAILAKIGAGQLIENYQTVRIHKSGKPIEVSVTISPVRDQTGKIIGASKIARDISERMQIERELALLAAIIASTADGVLSMDLNGTITSMNAAAERLFGYKAAELIGRSVRSLIPADQQDAEARVLKRAALGESIPTYEAVRFNKAGVRLEVAITNSPICNKQGIVIGTSKIIRDVAEKKRAERSVQELLHEVNHRSKNMLAIVQSIATQAASKHPAEFLELFTMRLRSLAASQDLLVKSEWRSVAFNDVLRAQLGLFSELFGERIKVQGPHLQLAAQPAQSLGMALHELTTNAIKFGALSNNLGSVTVTWGLRANESGQTIFELTWAEQGGPEVEPPVRRGFGATVIEAIPKYELQASVIVDRAQSGLQWRLSCNAERVLANDASNHP